MITCSLIGVTRTRKLELAGGFIKVKRKIQCRKLFEKQIA